MTELFGTSFTTVNYLRITVVLYMGIAMMPRQMTMNLLYMEGTMMTRNKAVAYLAGAMMHTAMGIVFALVHVAFYQAFDLTDNLVAWGVLFGFVHYLVVGMALGMIGSMHPLMRSGGMERCPAHSPRTCQWLPPRAS